MKKVVLIIVMCILQQSFAQDTCTSPQEESSDPNSMVTHKCEIETKNLDSKETTNVVLNERFLKRRRSLKKKDFVTGMIPSSQTQNKSVESIELSEIKNNIKAVAVSMKESTAPEVISFADVDEIPSFLSCEDDTEDQLTCFSYQMQKHIEENFQYPAEAIDNKIEGSVLVSFVITLEGDVTDVKTIAPQNAEVLKKEAQRIVSLLPKFVPGKHHDKNTSVSYSFPMEFSLE